jgi:hypothetical protein
MLTNAVSPIGELHSVTAITPGMFFSGNLSGRQNEPFSPRNPPVQATLAEPSPAN